MTACGAGAPKVDWSINFTPVQLDLDTSHWPIHHCRCAIHMFNSNSSHNLVELQPSQVTLLFSSRFAVTKGSSGVTLTDRRDSLL